MKIRAIFPVLTADVDVAVHAADVKSILPTVESASKRRPVSPVLKIPSEVPTLLREFE